MVDKKELWVVSSEMKKEVEMFLRTKSLIKALSR